LWKVKKLRRGYDAGAVIFGARLVPVGRSLPQRAAAQIDVASLYFV
jgi:hypothetical protein